MAANCMKRKEHADSKGEGEFAVNVLLDEILYILLPPSPFTCPF